MNEIGCAGLPTLCSSAWCGVYTRKRTRTLRNSSHKTSYLYNYRRAVSRDFSPRYSRTHIQRQVILPLFRHWPNPRHQQVDHDTYNSNYPNGAIILHSIIPENNIKDDSSQISCSSNSARDNTCIAYVSRYPVSDFRVINIPFAAG
jgi:hypothetical protein